VKNMAAIQKILLPFFYRLANEDWQLPENEIQ
jgi:hypothetical protein